MSVTLEQEYEMLISELRQNRQIQLQTFSMSPLWFSLFFGLIASNTVGSSLPIEFSLIPIPMLFISFLLILDRRKSSDVIIAYFRTAIDQRMATEPGWNHLLPKFRNELKKMQRPRLNEAKIPQRMDYNVMVWLSYLSMSFISLAIYYFSKGSHLYFTIITISIIALGYLLLLFKMMFQSAMKNNYINAWVNILKERLTTACT